MEADGSNEHTDSHSQDGYFEDGATAEAINKDEVDDGEEEIGARDHDGDCGCVGEPDETEEGGAVIHECVEATELRDCEDVSSTCRVCKIESCKLTSHNGTCGKDGSGSGGGGEDALGGLPEGLVGH